MLENLTALQNALDNVRHAIARTTENAQTGLGSIQQLRRAMQQMEEDGATIRDNLAACNAGTLEGMFPEATYANAFSAYADRDDVLRQLEYLEEQLQAIVADLDVMVGVNRTDRGEAV